MMVIKAKMEMKIVKKEINFMIVIKAKCKWALLGRRRTLAAFANSLARAN